MTIKKTRNGSQDFCLCVIFSACGADGLFFCCHHVSKGVLPSLPDMYITQAQLWNYQYNLLIVKKSIMKL